MSSNSRLVKDDSAFCVMRASFQEDSVAIAVCNALEMRAATVVEPNVVRLVSNVAIVAVLLCAGRDRPVLMSGI